MRKRYDPTTKDILYRDPPAWMSYMQLSAAGRPIEVIDADLSTVPSEADRVYRVGGPHPYLVHVEMQSRHDSRLARRLWRYNALLDLKYHLRVMSVALLLRREAGSRKLNGSLNLSLPGGEPVVSFRYRVVRAWEHPVAPILAGPLATLPMAALADVSSDDLPDVLENIDSRLAAEAPPSEAVRIMASTLILAGMRLTPDDVDTLRRRLRTMNILKDSSFYQVLLKEGKELGLEEGLRLGQLKEARKLLIRLGRARFGRLPNPTRAVIEGIDDLERLEQLSERILTATSWDDLLAGAIA